MCIAKSLRIGNIVGEAVRRRYDRGARRADQVAERRQQIVAAARDVLVGDGYTQFGLDSVAQHAGVTRMTIYNQFGSRLGLLDAVADDLTQRGMGVEQNDQALAQPTPSVALRALVTMVCRFWQTDPLLFRRLVGLSAVDPQVRETFEARDQIRRESVARVVQGLAGEGRIRSPFTLEQATAAITVWLSFPTWDQLVAMLVDVQHLEDILTAMVKTIVCLDPDTR